MPADTINPDLDRVYAVLYKKHITEKNPHHRKQIKEWDTAKDLYPPKVLILDSLMQSWLDEEIKAKTPSWLGIRKYFTNAIQAHGLPELTPSNYPKFEHSWREIRKPLQSLISRQQSSNEAWMHFNQVQLQTTVARKVNWANPEDVQKLLMLSLNLATALSPDEQLRLDYRCSKYRKGDRPVVLPIIVAKHTLKGEDLIPAHQGRLDCQCPKNSLHTSSNANCIISIWLKQLENISELDVKLLNDQRPRYQEQRRDYFNPKTFTPLFRKIGENGALTPESADLEDFEKARANIRSMTGLKFDWQQKQSSPIRKNIINNSPRSQKRSLYNATYPPPKRVAVARRGRLSSYGSIHMQNYNTNQQTHHQTLPTATLTATQSHSHGIVHGAVQGVVQGVVQPSAGISPATIQPSSISTNANQAVPQAAPFHAVPQATPYHPQYSFQGYQHYPQHYKVSTGYPGSVPGRYQSSGRFVTQADLQHRISSQVNLNPSHKLQSTYFSTTTSNGRRQIQIINELKITESREAILPEIPSIPFENINEDEIQIKYANIVFAEKEQKSQKQQVSPKKRGQTRQVTSVFRGVCESGKMGGGWRGEVRFLSKRYRTHAGNKVEDEGSCARAVDDLYREACKTHGRKKDLERMNFPTKDEMKQIESGIGKHGMKRGCCWKKKELVEYVNFLRVEGTKWKYINKRLSGEQRGSLALCWTFHKLVALFGKDSMSGVARGIVLEDLPQKLEFESILKTKKLAEDPKENLLPVLELQKDISSDVSSEEQ